MAPAPHPEPTVVTGIPALLFLAVAVWACIWLARRPGYRELIEGWCAEHRLRLVHMDRRWFCKGPFFFTPNGVAVFYLTVRDQTGLERHYWVRCGHWLFGMFAPEVSVRPAD